MERKKGWMWMLAGVILAFLAGLLVYRLLTSAVRSATTPKKTETKPVVVAVQDIPMRTVIGEDMVQVRDMPVDLIPEGAITDINDAVGKMPLTDLITGEVLIENRLIEPTNVTRHIALAIPKQKVIIALPADDLLNKVAMIKPGDRVDIMVSLPYGDGPQGTVSVDVLQNVIIQAVVVPPMPNTGDEKEGKNTQTFSPEDYTSGGLKAILVAVSPQDALVLKYLRDVGALVDFALRAPDDESTPFLEPVDFEYIQDVFGVELTLPENTGILPTQTPVPQPLPVSTPTP